MLIVRSIWGRTYTKTKSNYISGSLISVSSLDFSPELLIHTSNLVESASKCVQFKLNREYQNACDLFILLLSGFFPVDSHGVEYEIQTLHCGFKSHSDLTCSPLSTSPSAPTLLIDL